MVLNKRTKVSRHRGTNSHGWGHKKKHRGAGHRGGVGMAGSGARGDTLKPTILTKFGKGYFGKRGFSSLAAKKRSVLSLSYIQENFDGLVKKGLIIKEKEKFVFDTTLAYDKVLGNKELDKPLTLIVKEISQNAKNSVEKAKGEVIIKENTKVKKESSINKSD